MSASVCRLLAPLALVLAAILAPLPARAADDDPWFSRDKSVHFAASAGIAAGGYVAGVMAFDSRGAALAVGGALAASAGIAKEAADLAGLGDPSWKDLAWDGVGTVAGLAVAWGLDLLIRGISEGRPLLRGPSACRCSGIAF